MLYINILAIVNKIIEAIDFNSMIIILSIFILYRL